MHAVSVRSVVCIPRFVSFILFYGKLTALVSRFLVQKRPSRLAFIDNIIDTSYV